jgi:hypothetical protein
MLQVTLQFAVADTGWSEVHYFNATDASALISNAGVPLSPLSDLIAARRGLLPYRYLLVGATNPPPLGGLSGTGGFQALTAANILFNPRLVRARVSVVDPGNFRRVRVYTLPVGNSFGTYPGQLRSVNEGAFEAETWTRLELACQLANDNNGHIYLGGVPEDCVQAPDGYAPTGAFTTALNSYIAVLVANFLTRIRPYSGVIAAGVVNAAPPQPVLTFQVAPTGTFANTTALLAAPQTVPPTAVGGFIQTQVILRARHPSQWNGQHRALATVGNLAAVPPVPWGYVLGPSRGPLGDWAGQIPGSPLGTLQIASPQWPTYLAITPERLDHRPVGPPFARPHGRRKRAS